MMASFLRVRTTDLRDSLASPSTLTPISSELTTSCELTLREIKVFSSLELPYGKVA